LLGATLKAGALYLLPIIAIVVSLIFGYSATKSALNAIAVTILVYLLLTAVKNTWEDGEIRGI
jgi:TRAP-type uncharacterized transport system fused permease subunit